MFQGTFVPKCSWDHVTCGLDLDGVAMMRLNCFHVSRQESNNKLTWFGFGHCSGDWIKMFSVSVLRKTELVCCALNFLKFGKGLMRNKVKPAKKTTGAVALLGHMHKKMAPPCVKGKPNSRIYWEREQNTILGSHGQVSTNNCTSAAQQQEQCSSRDDL